MSSCFSGGTAYSLSFDLIKPHTSSWASNSASSSSSYSALSESNHGSISTRKARTRRKRPNQTYNEAASILSSAYPKLFTAKHLQMPQFTESPDEKSTLMFEPSDLLVPPEFIDDSACLRQTLERPNFGIKSKDSSSIEDPRRGQEEFDNSSEKACDEHEENFRTQSILDDEIGEGIDCVMGKLSMENLRSEETINHAGLRLSTACCYGYPVGLGFDFGIGMRNQLRAMRNLSSGDDDSLRNPLVDLADLTPKIAEVPVEKKSKKKNSGSGKRNRMKSARTDPVEEKFVRTGGQLLLKLNYEGVLSAWSGRGSPFCNDKPAAGLAGDLNPSADDGAGRNANVRRDQEKQPTHLLPKKIRCQLRKVKANQRPRSKGRSLENAKPQ